MKTNKRGSCVVQGAAEWEKRQKHEEIMSRLESVHGWGNYVEDYDQYPVYQWTENVLSEQELDEIMERGETSEICYMIERYAELAKQRGHGAILPEKIQVKIAKRHVQSEIQAYLRYQGFCEKGQAEILKHGNHEEIMFYVSCHGLTAKMQMHLIERDREDEIVEHIRRHGLADGQLIDIFKRLYLKEDYAFFYRYIENHELSVLGQKLMLKFVNREAFMSYIQKYGLWEEAHEELLAYRSMDEIISYFKLHHYVCPKAEDAMASRENKEERHCLIMAYIDNWRGTYFMPYDHFVQVLLKMEELDEEALSKVLSTIDYRMNTLCCDDKADVQLMSNGSREEVESRLESGKLLNILPLTALFFRDMELFRKYLDGCLDGRCYAY